MNAIRTFVAAALLAALTGCASGPVFVKPEPEKLVLGKSTKDDVLRSQQAKPISQQEITLNGEKVLAINYATGESPKFWGMLIERRFGSYTLFNDVLVGQEFNSTYDGESTDFDTTKIPQIVKGKTTRSEVIALLGKPSGTVIYPVIADKKGSGLVYGYTWARFAGMLTMSKTNLVVVTLDENNIVTNVSFKYNGEEQIKG